MSKWVTRAFQHPLPIIAKYRLEINSPVLKESILQYGTLFKKTNAIVKEKWKDVKKDYDISWFLLAKEVNSMIKKDILSLNLLPKSIVEAVIWESIMSNSTYKHKLLYMETLPHITLCRKSFSIRNNIVWINLRGHKLPITKFKLIHKFAMSPHTLYVTNKYVKMRFKMHGGEEAPSEWYKECKDSSFIE